MKRNAYKYLAAGLFLAASVAPAFAAETKPMLNKSLFSIGLGVSENSISGPIKDETGFQFFAAYDLPQVNLMESVSSSIEFGYLDYGFSRDDTGIWGTYVIDGAISGNLGWLARLGLDVGDDSGLMFGAGASYAFDKKSQFRLEYVVRDDIDSLQLNFLYHL